MDSVVRLFLLGCHGFRNQSVLKDRASTLERKVSILPFSSGVQGFFPLKRAVPENLHWAEFGQKAFWQQGTKEGENKAFLQASPMQNKPVAHTFSNESLPATATVKVQRNTDLSNLFFSGEMCALFLPHSPILEGYSAPPFIPTLA